MVGLGLATSTSQTVESVGVATVPVLLSPAIGAVASKPTLIANRRKQVKKDDSSREDEIGLPLAGTQAAR